MTITSAENPAPVEALRCMEIWGGNRAFDNAIAVAGIDAWVYSQPYAGDRSGGDVHYISTCGHGHIARYAIADVSGHGADAGDLSHRLRQLMRRNMNRLDQTQFVRALNEDFTALAAAGRFATALLMSYYAPTDQLLVCNAGHPPPLWYKAREKSWQVLDREVPTQIDGIRNLPLGIVRPTEYVQFAVQLEPDDLILAYTDWLIEARSPAGALLNQEGLYRMVEELDAERPEAMIPALLERVEEYRDSAPADDDRTVILLHHNAADPPRMSVRDYASVLGKALHMIPV